MSQNVTVSNGREFFRIGNDDLSDATAEGFYRPIERGQTIVSNGHYLFEIPITSLDRVEVSSTVAQQVFECLLAARQQLGDELGAKASLEKMAQVLGTSDLQVAPKLLSVMTRTIQRLKSSSAVSSGRRVIHAFSGVGSSSAVSLTQLDGKMDTYRVEWFRIWCASCTLTTRCADRAASRPTRSHGDLGFF